MSIWGLMGVVFAAGALGGLINALMSDNGFGLPKTHDVNGVSVWRPGVIGNVAVGAVAAFVSWGLYGRYAGVEVIGANGDATFSETLSSVAAAILVGIGGARFLSAEVDKRLLRLAGSAAAISPTSQDTATAIALATPTAALEAAREDVRAR